MKRFPAFIDLKNRPTIIVGGGGVAFAKARLAAASGAAPTFIWPDISPEIRRTFKGVAKFCYRKPEVADFSSQAVVFVATEDGADQWARMARLAGALVNVVDKPTLCDFTTPSIVDRGRLTVAISTDGAAPILGRRLREKIETLLPERSGILADFAGSYREAVTAKIPVHQRRSFWESFFDGPIAALVLAGDETAAHEAMLAAINTSYTEEKTGIVHIVGAGPGDPDLLTLKALRLLQSADVIVHDRLVSDEILALARRDAERLYVGKAKADHAVPQSEIEATLISLALSGKNVVRLKGGDPFVFGRGGEELDAMRAAGIPVFVTPGITAATGCAAATGFPLTHRDFSQAVTFVTGHAKGDRDPDLDWSALAALKNTLVVYMGVTKAGVIADSLIEHGRAGSTPVAIVENGTRQNQKIIKGELADIKSLVASNDVTGPAILVIGEVAARADAKSLESLTEQERKAA